MASIKKKRINLLIEEADLTQIRHKTNNLSWFIRRAIKQLLAEEKGRLELILEELKEIRFELKKQGVNINTYARAANIWSNDKSQPFPVIENFIKLTDEVEKLVSILDKVINKWQ